MADHGAEGGALKGLRLITIKRGPEGYGFHMYTNRKLNVSVCVCVCVCVFTLVGRQAALRISIRAMWACANAVYMYVAFTGAHE